jgi:hypothetical protein
MNGGEDTAAFDFAKKFNKHRHPKKNFPLFPFLAQYSVSRGKTFPKI